MTPPSLEIESDDMAKRFKLMERPKVAERPRMELTDRDKQILKTLYYRRMLSLTQIQQRFFPGDPDQQAEYQSRRGTPKVPNQGPLNQARHRMKLLFRNAYVYRGQQLVRVSDGSLPTLYFLDQRGAEAVADLLHTSLETLYWSPKHKLLGDNKIRHTLERNEFWLAIHHACSQHNWQITKWLTEFDLDRIQGEAKETVTVSTDKGSKTKSIKVPDDFLVLKHPDGTQYHFTTEIDRSTETARRWKEKIHSHIAYYRSGKYESRYKTRDWRCLIVATESYERMKNLKQWTEEAGGKGRFWLTSKDRLTTHDSLTSPIWYKAGDNQLTHSLDLQATKSIPPA